MHIFGTVGGDKYMGYNLFMHRSKSREFKNILDKLSSKTKSWNATMLSKARKLLIYGQFYRLFLVIQ